MLFFIKHTKIDDGGKLLEQSAEVQQVLVLFVIFRLFIWFKKNTKKNIK